MSSVKYHKLSRKYGTPGTEKYTELQFKRPKPKAPVSAIFAAAALMTVGSVLIIVGSLLLSGHISAEYSDRTWPVLSLGLLTFIPGFYHVRIAYYAWMGYKGYSFDDIPEYN